MWRSALYVYEAAPIKCCIHVLLEFSFLFFDRVFLFINILQITFEIILLRYSDNWILTVIKNMQPAPRDWVLTS